MGGGVVSNDIYILSGEKTRPQGLFFVVQRDKRILSHWRNICNLKRYTYSSMKITVVFMFFLETVLCPVNGKLKYIVLVIISL